MGHWHRDNDLTSLLRVRVNMKSSRTVDRVPGTRCMVGAYNYCSNDSNLEASNEDRKKDETLSARCPSITETTIHHQRRDRGQMSYPPPTMLLDDVTHSSSGCLLSEFFPNDLSSNTYQSHGPHGKIQGGTRAPGTFQSSTTGH